MLDGDLLLETCRCNRIQRVSAQLNLCPTISIDIAQVNIGKIQDFLVRAVIGGQTVAGEDATGFQRVQSLRISRAKLV